MLEVSLLCPCLCISILMLQVVPTLLERQETLQGTALDRTTDLGGRSRACWLAVLPASPATSVARLAYALGARVSVLLLVAVLEARTAANSLYLTLLQAV